MADLCRLRIRDDAGGGDDAQKEDIKMESKEREGTEKDSEPFHGHEYADGTYLRRRVHFLESEVSHLLETVERLTEECSKRAVTEGSNDGEGQVVGIITTRGRKGNGPGATTGMIMGHRIRIPIKNFLQKVIISWVEDCESKENDEEISSTTNTSELTWRSSSLDHPEGLSDFGKHINKHSVQSSK